MEKGQDVLESGKLYHIYSRAIGKELLFLNEENYKFFLKKYDQYCSSIFETIAYCLIPNHFHLLVRIKDDIANEVVVRDFSNFLNSYSKSFNNTNGRRGGLFQRKFKRKLIDREPYLSRIILYIHLNPVKHEIVDDFSEWQFSSYNSYCTNKPSKIFRELGLEWFGGIEEFQKIHQEIEKDYLPEDLRLEI
ncbi:transposase [Algoriphagus sp.]|uniref:transposase n=1 Tax=Algoriphagus sp. TaxID=1872435 RepID=UPI0032969D3A